MSAATFALGLAVLLLASPALAGAATKYSGTITAVDSAKHSLRLTEMGPWHPTHASVIKHSIEIGPATKLELVTRAKDHEKGVHGWPGGYTESRLAAGDVRPGDYATVTFEHDGSHRRAVSVDVVQAPNAQAAAQGETAGASSGKRI